MKIHEVCFNSPGAGASSEKVRVMGPLSESSSATNLRTELLDYLGFMMLIANIYQCLMLMQVDYRNTFESGLMISANSTATHLRS